jgi:hypothetical protein
MGFVRLLFIVGFIIGHLSVAFADDLALSDPHLFNPVATSNSRTLGQWKVAFQRNPGANLNSTLLVNSLSVGLLPRVEVGVVPIYYGVEAHKSNFNLKYNFWRGDDADWAFGLSETRFKTEIQSANGRIERPDLVLTTLGLSANYHPDYMDSIVSAFVANSCGKIESKDALVLIYSLKCTTEYGMDWQIPVKDRQWVTLGWGQLRKTGFSAYEPLETGFGTAYSMRFPGALISRPSLGVYYTPDGGNMAALLSTTFYEK